MPSTDTPIMQLLISYSRWQQNDKRLNREQGARMTPPTSQSWGSI